MTAPIRTVAWRRVPVTETRRLLDNFTAAPVGAIDGRQAQIGGAWKRMYGLVGNDVYSDIQWATSASGLARDDYSGSVWESLIINRHLLSGDSWSLATELHITEDTLSLSDTASVQLVLIGNLRELVPLAGSGYGGATDWRFGRIDGVYAYLFYRPDYGTEPEVGTYQGVTNYGSTGQYLVRGVNTVVVSRQSGTVSVTVNGAVAASGAMRALQAGQFDDVALGLAHQGNLDAVRILSIQLE